MYPVIFLAMDVSQQDHCTSVQTSGLGLGDIGKYFNTDSLMYVTCTLSYYRFDGSSCTGNWWFGTGMG
jgi:hypothetical protein